MEKVGMKTVVMVVVMVVIIRQCSWSASEWRRPAALNDDEADWGDLHYYHLLHFHRLHWRPNWRGSPGTVSGEDGEGGGGDVVVGGDVAGGEQHWRCACQRAKRREEELPQRRQQLDKSWHLSLVVDTCPTFWRPDYLPQQQLPSSPPEMRIVAWRPKSLPSALCCAAATAGRFCCLRWGHSCECQCSPGQNRVGGSCSMTVKKI